MNHGLGFAWNIWNCCCPKHLLRAPPFPNGQWTHDSGLNKRAQPRLMARHERIRGTPGACAKSVPVPLRNNSDRMNLLHPIKVLLEDLPVIEALDLLLRLRTNVRFEFVFRRAIDLTENAKVTGERRVREF